MQTHEYKVVPAPKKGEKARGLKSGEDRFAFALTKAMNDMAAEGWEYLRTDTMPVEERTGLTGRVSTSFQSVMVYRRALDGRKASVIAAPAPEPVAAPRLTTEAPDGAAPALGSATAEDKL